MAASTHELLAILHRPDPGAGGQTRIVLLGSKPNDIVVVLGIDIQTAPRRRPPGEELVEAVFALILVLVYRQGRLSLVVVDLVVVELDVLQVFVFLVEIVFGFGIDDHGLPLVVRSGQFGANPNGWDGRFEGPEYGKPE